MDDERQEARGEMQDPQAETPVFGGAVRVLDPTGVPSLDLILGGGVLQGSLVILMGPPGCGKTTLASQIAFAAARDGRRTLILTSLSEPNNKLLAHLSSYEFYDPELIGDAVSVLSLQQFLPGGLASTADAVVGMIRKGQANLVVLDGFSGIRAADPDPRAARQFLFDIGTTLSLYGVTTIITSEAEVRDPRSFPEATTADVILGLYFSAHGERQRRRLEVVKARGASPLPGLHGLAIDATGIVLAPRLEARMRRERSDAPPDALSELPTAAVDRASLDMPALDVLLGGGLTRSTTTVVLGSGGTGKTLLALQFALAGVRAGESVVFLSFHEDRRQLLLKADAFDLGQDLRVALAPGGGLTLLHQRPVELEADALADGLLTALDRSGAQRLVVDSIAEVERAVAEGSGQQRVQNYLAALVSALQARRITALLIRETGALAGVDLHLETDLSSGVAENVLWLQGVIYKERFIRVLSVLKMRYSPHDLTLREFTISAPAGLVVQSPNESQQSMLAGIARQQGDPWTGSMPPGLDAPGPRLAGTWPSREAAPFADGGSPAGEP